MSKLSVSSTAYRPPAVPAQPAGTLHDEHGGALGTGGCRVDGGMPGTGDQHLPLAACIPIDGDSLATKLVRELVRSFHIRRGRVLGQVDGLADRRMHAPLKHGLHAD